MISGTLHFFGIKFIEQLNDASNITIVVNARTEHNVFDYRDLLDIVNFVIEVIVLKCVVNVLNASRLQGNPSYTQLFLNLHISQS